MSCINLNCLFCLKYINWFGVKCNRWEALLRRQLLIVLQCIVFFKLMMKYFKINRRLLREDNFKLGSSSDWTQVIYDICFSLCKQLKGVFHQKLLSLLFYSYLAGHTSIIFKLDYLQNCHLPEIEMWYI